LGLIGPNGAGKTTLFECLAGLLPADEGLVRGADGATLPPRRRQDLLFYVPDGISPWPDQPVGRLLDVFSALWGVAAERRSAPVAALNREAPAGAAVGTLSRGERKRLLIALGLLVPKPLTLLDEPFDGLDPRQAREAAALLRAEAAAGRALFLSIHQ